MWRPALHLLSPLSQKGSGWKKTPSWIPDSLACTATREASEIRTASATGWGFGIGTGGAGLGFLGSSVKSPRSRSRLLFHLNFHYNEMSHHSSQFFKPTHTMEMLQHNSLSWRSCNNGGGQSKTARNARLGAKNIYDDKFFNNRTSHKKSTQKTWKQRFVTKTQPPHGAVAWAGL